MRTLFIVLTLSIPFLACAQERIEVTEEVAVIGDESRSALAVQINGANADEVSKAWKKLLKDLKGKVSDKPVIFADDCREETMGDSTFDVYSLVEQVTDGLVSVTAAFDVGGAFLNSTDHTDRFPAAQKIVRDFAVTQAKNAVQTEIETSQGILKGLEKDQSGLEKDKEKLEKDIKGYEEDIEENKASIKKNVADQASKQKEVHRLEGSQIEGQIEEVQKVIKGFKKDLNGMVKDKEKLEKDNEDLTAKIKQAKADIEKNLADQTSKKAEIERARSIIQNLKIKLHAIH